MTVRRRTTLMDRAVRIALIAAFHGQKLVWRFRRPSHRGVAVAVWYGGKVLIVRHSYRPGRALPGGRLRRGETPADGACRELREELGLRMTPADLTLIRPGRRTSIYEYHPTTEPHIEIDNREIIEAAFVAPDDLADVDPSVRHALIRS
jgi:8-oxo-dGTP pyrophosphatase MutT (NUDIX family)